MKVFILTTDKCPYRVELFDLLGEKLDLTVAFEEKQDYSREDGWYSQPKSTYKVVHLEKWEKPLKSIKLDAIRQIRANKPDVVIFYEYSTRTAMVAMSYCKLHHIPYIINCDGGFISKSKLKTFVKRHYISGAKGYVAGGEYAKKYLTFYGAKTDDINIINFSSVHRKDILDKLLSYDEKNNIREQLGIAEKKVVMFVGQFIPRKGIDVLLRAAQGMSSDIGFYIIGGNKEAVQALTNDDYNKSNFHFVEFMKSDELKKYYMCSDLFVLPTREDIWGLVINEAMAFGLPVITTNRCIAGLELITNGENGFIIENENSDELRDRMNQILSDDKLIETMGKNNINSIQDYTVEGMAEAVYRSVMINE